MQNRSTRLSDIGLETILTTFAVYVFSHEHLASVSLGVLLVAHYALLPIGPFRQSREEMLLDVLELS